MKIWILTLQDGWQCAVPAATVGDAYRIATARIESSKRPLLKASREVKPIGDERYLTTLRRACSIVRSNNVVVTERATKKIALELV